MNSQNMLVKFIGNQQRKIKKFCIFSHQTNVNIRNPKQNESITEKQIKMKLSRSVRIWLWISTLGSVLFSILYFRLETIIFRGLWLNAKLIHFSRFIIIFFNSSITENCKVHYYKQCMHKTNLSSKWLFQNQFDS